MGKASEVNFDGLVGPSHNYAGLSYGNIASIDNARLLANPRQAALQGLEKMHFLASLGIHQAVLPPHERPYIPFLRALGFTGSDSAILQHVGGHHPQLLLAVSSSASMWAANAATVSPSADCRDGVVHFTPANMTHHLHRSLEGKLTGNILRAIFNHPKHFRIHDQLPSSRYLGDEGAANHLRFCKEYGDPGVELFVYGKKAFGDSKSQPTRYPARQTLEASQAVARWHQLDSDRLLFAQQNPAAIDAGAFHNDVVSVSDRNLFFFHEQAFLDTPQVIDLLQKKMNNALICIQVARSDLSLEEAVASYLFNSQIVTIGNKRIMIAPIECQELPKVHAFCNQLKGRGVDQVHYVNLRESMRNGGGPACLRLRVVLTPEELAAMNPHVLLTDALYETLKRWINNHYRDRLEAADLTDPKLLEESHAALDELTSILHLGPIYSFQQGTV